MAVETFFLFGFRALSDMIKEIFPPGESNTLLMLLNQYESNKLSNDQFLTIARKSIEKYIEITFRFKDLKFHVLKQLEPALGYEVFIHLRSMPPIIAKFSKSLPIIAIDWATQEAMVKFSGISSSLDLAKNFLKNDLDVLKLITEGQIQIEKFEELNEIIVRALLGFTSAFFLNKSFQNTVKSEINALVSSSIS